ncbi:MAG: biopolymer transporter ExbD [Verrucomicrobia bacterium]|nr:biopolymer transporter ExbD [Verrucomicrobiota bacterium]
MPTRRKTRRRSTDVDLTSLMDVIFLLLIFFMVATSFHEETRALEVTLPRAENPTIISLDDGVTTVTLTNDKRIFVNDKEISARDLKQALTDEIESTDHRHVLVKGDTDAPYRNVTAIIDVVSGLDIEGISFAVVYTSL